MGLVVRALFRVLSVTHTHDGVRQVHFAPTLASRDGKECEENKAFWKATPSGDGHLNIAVDAEASEFFVPGSYLYLDFRDIMEDLPEPQEGTWRSEWEVSELTLLSSKKGFRVELSAWPGPWRDGLGHDNGKYNAKFFARSWASASIKMNVENPAAFQNFVFSPGEQRRLFVDFRRAEPAVK